MRYWYMSDIKKYTNWFDVKDYTSVVLTVKTGSGSYFDTKRPFTLIWGKGDADHPPFDSDLTGDEDANHEKDIICSDTCPAMKADQERTFEFPVRTRWVLLKQERDVTGSYAEVSFPMFKKAPSALSIRDDTKVTEIASVMVDISPSINYITGGSLHQISENGNELAKLEAVDDFSGFTVSVEPGWSGNFHNETAYANDLGFPITLTDGSTSIALSANDNIVLQIHNIDDPTQVYYYDIYTNSMDSGSTIDHSDTRYTVTAFHPYTENAIKVGLTDSSGLMISTTNHFSHANALFTHMSNSGGDSVDTLGKKEDTIPGNRNLGLSVLATTVMDASNFPIASTGGSDDNALITAFTDSDTSVQAATEPIRFGGQAGDPGVTTTKTVDGSGRALYYAMSDHLGTPYTSIDTSGYHKGKLRGDISYNAMYVHLTDSVGKSIAKDHQLPCTLGGRVVKSLKNFDAPIESSMTVINSDLSNNSFHLHHLGIANELPVTIWVKVYDVSQGYVATDTSVFTKYKQHVVYNIPVTPGNYRDLNMSEGVPFENGLYMRINDGYEYDNSYYPIGGGNAGKVYVTGTYYKKE